MKRVPIRIAIVVAALLLLAAVATPALLLHSSTLDEEVPSVALAGKVHALVVLPAGYATSGLRYPVIYFLHGLPASPTAYKGSGWVARALARTGPAILVEPQGARKGDTDPEYLNWGTGRNWETFIAEELPRYIDAHFRTIRSRAGRALVGLSAGGYGATVLGLHHLGSFSVIESWSGYFHPTDSTGTIALDRGPATNVHTLIVGLAKDEEHRPTFFAFYVGRGDKRFRDENVELDRELTEAEVPHIFEVYAGGHSTAVWERHAPQWLRLALEHLASPQR